MADVNPKGPRTGHSNPGCYLSAVDDNCSTKLTHEHFLSKAILEIWRDQSGGVLVGGFPWLTEPKSLPPNALTGRILCDRHNEALSDLDQCALDFYRCLLNVPSHLREPGERKDELYMFSGPDLERWTIKLLAGLIASGNAILDGKKFEGAVPAFWLEVLLGRKQLPVGLGLGSLIAVGEPPKNVPRRIEFRPMFLKQDGARTPAGAELWINGLALGLVLVQLHDKSVAPWAANYLPHPHVIRYSGPSSSVTIMLAGNGWDEGSAIELGWLPDKIV
jgi:hypothetical protein